jgi:ubiquinone/menaquinone biosynthesis C-methylase UbiE
MADGDTVFAGSIPAIYDRFMVPLLFQPYADLVAQRARAHSPARILETAAGTGVLIPALHRAIPSADVVATDLNAPMLAIAASRVASAKIRFQQADALALPFEDGAFDLVVCQFGVMFFPDKLRGHREARRVLEPGGKYMLVIWDQIGLNLASRAAGEAVAQLFPTDADAFYERVPFRYHDPVAIERDLRNAGFANVELETVELRSRAASARDVAIGLVQGTPVRTEIESRDPAMLELATDTATEALRQFEGPDGFDAPMSAHIVVATR